MRMRCSIDVMSLSGVVNMALSSSQHSVMMCLNFCSLDIITQ